MEQIKYQLSTLSSLIVSPRSNLAWYKELNEFIPEMIPGIDHLDKKRLSVIYPFYQYGEYEEWSKDADYYLPGSSIKGALCEQLTVRDNIMVDDVKISNQDIVVRNLYKAQDLGDPKKAQMEWFLKNIGIEMVKANTNLSGEIYAKDAGDVKRLLNHANDLAKIKMRQMLTYLSALYEQDYKKELKDFLHGAIGGLTSLIEANDVILLGGYKGLLHSIEIKDYTPVDMQKESGAVYLDPETGLLHGLTRFEVLV